MSDAPCPACGHFANRGVSVDAVVTDGSEVLLVRRSREPDRGRWATPGGYVEWDESAEEAVRREVLEETGVTIGHVRLLAVRTAPDRHPKQVINLVYLARLDGRVPARAADDADAVGWFALDALPLPLALDHERSLADARAALGDVP